MARISTSRKSGLVLRGGSMRKETLWFKGLEFLQVIGGAAAPVLLGSLNAAALALRPFTVVRTRGAIHLSSDQIAADEVYGAAYGQAVVSDQAAAIGVTAVPTPVTDDNSDLWFVFEYMFGSFVFSDATGASESGITQTTIDSKAMRKVQEGEDIVLVLERATNGFGITALGYTRMLIKLH